MTTDQDGLTGRILLDSLEKKDPTRDPYIKVGLSRIKESSDDKKTLCLEESEYIRSFLIPVENKDVFFQQCHYGDFFGDSTYFDDDGVYHPNDVFEEKGVSLENIIYHRHIPELGLDYFEPSERFVLYHNLHRKGDVWIYPYDEEKIIQKTGEKGSWDPHEYFIAIRKSELIDYLAARRCGLLLLRYAECVCYSDKEFTFLPATFRNKPTEFGYKSFFNDGRDESTGRFRYFCRLWDSFWIDPASEPRRGDYRTERELKGDVEFIFADGERGTFFDPLKGSQTTEKTEARFFQTISLNPRILKDLMGKPNHTIRFHSLTNLDVVYPDGQILSGCINAKKQFQVFFGDLAKLDRYKQRHLAGFSEPEKERLSPEYFIANIEARCPPTRPFEDTLSKCLKIVNQPWLEKFGERLLLTPEKEKISINIRLGCLSNTPEDLTDVVLELRKVLITENKIDTIKQKIDLSKFFDNPTDYQNAKSVSFMTRLFENNKFGIDPKSAEILRLIEDLRHAKSHPKDLPALLSKYGLANDEPLEIYYKILAKLCKFLIDFRALTVSLLNVTIKETEEWRQIKFAQKYFENPF